jgi:choline dehydrogenase-like flavoprotein
MIVDSRSIDNSCRLQSEICIVGAGAAGITLALELLSKNVSVVLLESGGAKSDSMTQSLYAGENAGLSYDPLEETRSRYLGGSTNCWGGWCRPLDDLDFEKRDWVPNSGWPFGKKELYRHYVRSHSLLQLGPFNYDQDFWSHELAKKNISLFPLDGRRIDNIVIQCSPPSRFGSLYRPQLSQSSKVKVLLFANVTEIQTNESATEVTGVRVATLNGTNFTVSAKLVVLAAGGIENARLLLLSASAGPMAANASAAARVVWRIVMVVSFCYGHIPGCGKRVYAPFFLRTTSPSRGHEFTISCFETAGDPANPRS